LWGGIKSLSKEATEADYQEAWRQLVQESEEE
jgi:hypothetical protein